jgi:hypothetical protein
MPDKEQTLGNPPTVPDSCRQVDNAERDEKLEGRAMQQNPYTMGHEHPSSSQ